MPAPLLLRVGVLLLGAASLGACAQAAGVSPRPHEAGLPAGRTLSVRNLIDALRAAGAKVQAQESIEQPFFAVPGKAIQVDGEGVQVYEFLHAQAADTVAATVSRDGSQVGTSKPFWIGPPHFYKRSNLLVLYLGEDEKVLKLLEDTLGRQFAGR